MCFVIVYNKLINNLFLICVCVYKCCSVLNTDFYLVFLTLCWWMFYLCVIIKKHFKIMKHFVSEILIMYITVLLSVFKLNTLNPVQRCKIKYRSMSILQKSIRVLRKCMMSTRKTLEFTGRVLNSRTQILKS